MPLIPPKVHLQTLSSPKISFSFSLAKLNASDASNDDVKQALLKLICAISLKMYHIYT